jgi:hypothetical protein
MNFNLFALFAATIVFAQGSTLQACNGDRWNNQLNKAFYFDKVKGFITTGNDFVLRSRLPAKHRIVGGEYFGDYQYIEDRLTITVDDNNKVVSLSCN